MASWTAISNLLVSVGAKPFASTMQALRDNPVAIAEGALGAPRIARGAISSFGLGGVAFYKPDGVFTNVGAVIQTAAEFPFVQSGVVQVYFEHRGVTDNVGAYITLLRGGTYTVLAAWSVPASGSYTARSANIAVQHGDLIAVRHNTGPGTGNTSYVTNINFLNDGTPMWDVRGGQVEF